MVRCVANARAKRADLIRADTSTSEQAVVSIRQRIREVTGQGCGALVGDYYDPACGFAGALFDEFEVSDETTNVFTSSDFVAASLLDVRFGPAAVRELLCLGEANDLLADIDTELDLWDATMPKGSVEWRLWDLLVAVDGIGPTRASKLLARKRPRLFPILDSVVSERLGLGSRDRWALLGAALDVDTREHVDALRAAVPGHSPSTLRLLDVATWMRFSASERARERRRVRAIPR